MKRATARDGGTRRAIAAALASMLIGLLVACWPHLVAWRTSGEPVWFADHDDTLYLAYTSQAYFEHPWTIADPMLPSGGMSLYPWAQMVPPVLAARAFGLGPAGVALMWRAWGGLALGLTTYLLGLVVTRKPLLAALLSLIVSCDAGIDSGRPLVRHARLLVLATTRGLSPQEVGLRPQLMPQWRVLTPAVSLPFLVAHVWLVLRAREGPSRRRVVLAGVSYGLLFYVYFYFWTAATVALVLAWLLDRAHRRSTFSVAVLGGLIGLPAVVSNYLTRRAFPDDWLHRTDKFLPIPRLSEWLIPWAAVAMLAVGLVWVMSRRRDLAYVWSMAVAGVVLANHQILSGLQIENFHWHYVWGPFTSLFLLLALLPPLLDAVSQTRAGRGAVVALAILGFASALQFRATEAAVSPDSREIRETYRDYRAQANGADSPRLIPNSVVAGSPAFVEMAAILDDLRPLDHYAAMMSPTIREPEREARVILNRLLLGRSRAEILEEQRAVVGGDWGPWARDPKIREAKLNGMAEAYDRIAADVEGEIRRFRVRYLAIPGESGVLPDAARWRKLHEGPRWTIYERLGPSTRRPGEGQDSDG